MSSMCVIASTEIFIPIFSPRMTKPQFAVWRQTKRSRKQKRKISLVQKWHGSIVINRRKKVPIAPPMEAQTMSHVCTYVLQKRKASFFAAAAQYAHFPHVSFRSRGYSMITPRVPRSVNRVIRIPKLTSSAITTFAAIALEILAAYKASLRV